MTLEQLQQHLVQTVEDTCSTFVADLGYIPDDKLLASPMGVARHPLSFTAECAAFNRAVAVGLLGRTLEIDYAQVQAEAAKIDSRDKAVEDLRTSCETLKNALSRVSDFTAEVKAPWGQPMSAMTLAGYAISHMQYHLGQVNYIQALYGDGEMHWAD